MRVRILTASLAVFVGIGALGCKSAPKMAWWSSSKDSKVESTAVAHAAPQLPSEVAKQTEAISAANPVQITTAPAFVPGTSEVSSDTSPAAPSIAPREAYPSTGAPSYVPTSSVAAMTTASMNAMPYNPDAVPAAKSVLNTESIATNPASQNTKSSPADRYGNLYSQTSESVAGPATMSGNSYPTYNTPSTSATTSPASSSTSGLGDRYAMSTTTVSASAADYETDKSQEVQAVSAIASAEPYRPGGTGTYPGSNASNAKYEVATRPSSPTSSQSAVPNVAYPSTGGSQYR